jgi:predicted nucleic-acid-binding Zn-ribbon protein
MMQHDNWSCPKCGHQHYDVGEMRVSGGFWSRIFDVQNKKYSAVTCQQCSYTEFYKQQASSLGNVFDFFTS